MMDLKRLTCVLGAAVLTACVGGGPSAPTRYYVLAPTADTGPIPSGAAATAGEGPSIELARVALPEYLNQSSIVTRSQTNEVSRAEYDLWAGPLADEVTRTLAENLSLALPTDRLATGSARRMGPADYVVEIEIVSFERDSANNVHLIARWSVYRDDGRTLIAMRRTVYQAPAAADYGTTVRAMSRVLGDLGTDIAGTIKKGGSSPAKANASRS